MLHLLATVRAHPPSCNWLYKDKIEQTSAQLISSDASAYLLPIFRSKLLTSPPGWRKSAGTSKKASEATVNSLCRSNRLKFLALCVERRVHHRFSRTTCFLGLNVAYVPVDLAVTRIPFVRVLFYYAINPIRSGIRVRPSGIYIMMVQYHGFEIPCIE